MRASVRLGSREVRGRNGDEVRAGDECPCLVTSKLEADASSETPRGALVFDREDDLADACDHGLPPIRTGSGLRERFRCVAVDHLGFGLSERPPGCGYTPGEHAEAVEELVESLGLSELIVMGHDWGGPIGLSVASSDRVAGLVLGNTWFWPPDRPMRIVSRIMSSPPLQWAIVRHNFFVERIIPSGTGRKLSKPEMDHYRGVQPSPEARAVVAEFPRHIVAASSWLRELEVAVRRAAGR